MLVDYLELAGVEIVNSARAAAYSVARGVPVQCDPCPELAGALGDLAYTDPVTDRAPWWDPGVPGSSGVLGVMGMSVAGFNASPLGREPVQLVGDGAALGVARRSHREIAYTVLLLTTGECALSYGLEWLAAALGGSACGTCDGDEMCVFSCCPVDGTRELRHLYGVGLLDGPQVTDTQYLPTGHVIATVTFSLAAGVPWIYREPLDTLTGWVSLAGGTSISVDPDQVYERCIEPTPCLEDPDCPAPTLPPRPPVPVDACYPSGRDQFLQSVIGLRPVDQPQWLETVPVLEVVTGRRAMRRLVVRFWTDPSGDCAATTDPCRACAAIQVPYLPARSVLRVDGRTQRAVVECPQGPTGTAAGAPTLYGPQGRRFEWPTFACATGLCIELLSLEETTADNARARVLLVPRSDAG